MTVGLYILGKEKQKKQIYERYKTNTLLFETYILSASRVLEKKKRQQQRQQMKRKRIDHSASHHQRTLRAHRL